MGAGMALDNDEDRPVAALERGLRILTAFSREVPELSLTELAERIGVHKSTVMRLANTLEAAGYLERSAAGKYCLGAMTLPLAHVYRASVRPPEIIVPLMRELVARTGESATFSVRRGDLRVCVYRVDSPSRIRDHFSVGDVFPVGQGASGQVFVKFERAALGRGAGGRPLRASDLVMSSSDALVEGMAGIAAPVFDETADLHGVLAVSGPKVRLAKDVLAALQGPLLATARAITFRLGGDVAAFDAAPAPRKRGAKRSS